MKSKVVIVEDKRADCGVVWVDDKKEMVVGVEKMIPAALILSTLNMDYNEW